MLLQGLTNEDTLLYCTVDAALVVASLSARPAPCIREAVANWH